MNKCSMRTCTKGSGVRGSAGKGFGGSWVVIGINNVRLLGGSVFLKNFGRNNFYIKPNEFVME